MSLSDEEIIRRNRSNLNISLTQNELRASQLTKKQTDDMFLSYWSEAAKESAQGYACILAYLGENPGMLKELEVDKSSTKITVETCYIKEENFDAFSDLEKMRDVMLGDTTLQHLWNISNEVLLVCYHIAGQLHEQKCYKKALSVFSFLILINPHIQSFWLGKGAANESNEELDNALADYWMAQSIEPENGRAYISIARILRKVGSKASLDSFFEILDKHPNAKKALASIPLSLKDFDPFSSFNS